jgi:hypothetical protein
MRLILGLAVGALLRHSAGAVTTVIGLHPRGSGGTSAGDRLATSAVPPVMRPIHQLLSTTAE